MQDHDSRLSLPFLVPNQEQTDALPKILGLVAFSFLFTAAGSIVGVAIGASAIPISFIGGLCTLLTLLILKEVSPLNLILLYTFSTLEGMLLGPVTAGLVAAGHGSVVLQTAAVTGIVTLIAGVSGVRTTRDLTSFGNLLALGLVALLGAMVVTFILQAPLLSYAISAVGALLFAGFIVYDLNKAARAGKMTEGDAIVLAVNIYLDILNLFLHLLRIVAALGGDD